MKEPKFKVMVDCCTSGNCIICMHLPYGSKVRSSLMGDTRMTKGKAEQIAKNWGAYRAKVEPFEEGK